MNADRARDARGPSALPAGGSTGCAGGEEEHRGASFRPRNDQPAETVLNQGSLDPPGGGASDEDLDALIASFSAVRES